MRYVRPKILSMKQASDITEADIQSLIADDPGVLGLGTLTAVAREVTLPGGGRLDVLLEDGEAATRYEVEIQLGKTDPSHIIRVIEYWDLQRRLYPQYDHIAVIVAEDITSRFLNVISLFNGVIPVVAVQMTAAEVDERRTIIFTKVLDFTALGGRDESTSNASQSFDRAYWDEKGPVEIVQLADKVLELAMEVLPDDVSPDLTYLAHRIVITRKSGETAAHCFPLKTSMRVAVPMNRSTETDEMLEASGLDVLAYNSRLNRYRIRLTAEGDQDWPALRQLLKRSLEEQP